MSLVKVEKKDNWAILSLAREPVNSLNLEVWRQLKAAFDKLEADQSTRGVIFTSGLARDVFTAGWWCKIIGLSKQGHCLIP